MECQYSCCYLVLLAGLLCCCVIASDWPQGYYGLPMANTGCPCGTTFDWKSGWIYQDTEDSNPRNTKSASFHLEGKVRPSSVNRSFCVKTQITNDHRRPLWPAGKYCIHQRTNNCPLGFKSGDITWDDEDNNNNNTEKGTLPKVILSSSYTNIYFCCRDDGVETNPIDLPIGSPFYLFAHKSLSCQQVKWAVATREWMLYDTEDDDNYDSVIRPAPYVEQIGDSGKIKIHYCYYTSCQYTLNASKGMIKFPAYSGNYENGQLCSWRITVHASQTIQVQFVKFQLSDIYDQLIFYDGKDDSAPLLATLYGKTPSDITPGVLQSSSSNLFLVFQSNRVDTASGFKASYTAIGTLVTVSPPAPSTAEATTTTTRAITTRATTTRSTTEIQVVSEKTNPKETALSSSNPPSKSSSEPSSLPTGNSSKNYDAFKKTCIQQSQSTLTAVVIVIPLICLIAVIAMAGYLYFRLRNLRDKPSDVSVRYTTTESVNNPAYIPSDAVIEANPPSTNNAYKDSKGDIYHEIEPSRQATNNPLYQSTEEDKQVYASFA